VSAARLHELRVGARRLVDEGKLPEAVRAYLVAADHAETIALRIEAEHLRSRARQVVVYIWARARWTSVEFDDVSMVQAPAKGLHLGPVRRFNVRGPDGERQVLIDTSDRVRLAPRRRS
jgi:hypothetical protein